MDKQVEFDEADLESLQEANVDNNLLENHFLYQKKQNAQTLKLQLQKHA